MSQLHRENQGETDPQVCACCQQLPQQVTIAVADPVALNVWNQLHPKDRRASLVYCSIGCAFAHAVQLGRRWARAELQLPERMPTCPTCLSDANVSRCVRVPAFRCAQCDSIFRPQVTP